MRVAIAADHAGYGMKEPISTLLELNGHTVTDFGATEMDPMDDYPDFATAVANSVKSGLTERGIVICGSGVGAAIAANKIRGVRASVCHDTYSARQGVEHDSLNVLCLGARVIGEESSKEVVAAFISATFTGEERHKRRLNKILELESNCQD